MSRHQWAELARTIADGTGTQAGDAVSVFLTDAGSVTAVDAFVAEVYRRGAFPQVLLTDERFDRSALEHADAAQLARVPDLEAEALRWSDVHVSFRGMLPPASPNMDDDRVATQRRAKGAISALRWSETRWAVVRVPTAEWARFTGIDEAALFDEFFAGCLRDWPAARHTWRGLAERLGRAGTMRITGPDTDLELGVSERTWVVFAGEANLPDGEIATAPVEESVTGYITFPERFYFAGRAVEGLRLTFEQGAVVDVHADEGEGLARALLATDPGARYVGELGIGVNAAMTTLTGDLFFDEKVLGTVHIALGRGYPECGGINQSTLHWDIVKDLRHDSRSGPGSLVVDGVSLIENGTVQPELWP
ncbi:aminopeptidase [Actinobacteria bacterium YIM 96077]|uniref:Aminopeptidase n=1 Tax=Phytoactinopolyspora halophila TaxID=1981511 RepID=A0A329QNT7_9ACTN|nr:aminopeptidase [Phytoactinopolyspora halophila]AYY12257.1 aminopeptidase [Actinobacteria bacterium YIM 96077]RAW13826.1 aminopeptidase [Phytoactinopolyspora halophila]